MTKDQVRRGFAKRLNEALDETPECPKATEDGGRGRAAWLAKRYGVTGEAASKWLDGRGLPSMVNIARIAADLRIDPCWLWSGQGSKRPQEALEIVALYSDTDEFGQSNILQTARAWHRARPRTGRHDRAG